MYDYKDPLSFSAAIFLILNGIFGIYTNGSIFLAFVDKKTEKTSFKLICFLRALGNIYVIVIIFWITFLPVVIFGENVLNYKLENIFISTGINLYLVNNYLSLIVALNRFIALYFPLYFSKLCGFKMTFFIYMVYVAFRVSKIINEVFITIKHNCTISFNSTLMSWENNGDKICKDLIGDSQIMVFGLTLLGVMLLNTFTIIKIYRFHKSKITKTIQLKKNIKLFMQTCIQDSLLLIDAIFTFELSQLSDSRLWSFISFTLVWMLIHSFDGFIMMMFDDRSRVKKRNSLQNATISVRVLNTVT
ncbi:unnamed protein product [Caenorhabditis angaria]|uniref:7TM GPCR serpentine receptor class x (Srx) domain-containing protein n=1 Tax=Caenorhabditis angaria TaxID=860376 RepID=A0A9P1IE59_9PELO|nr:unnamed protein product [Caenorhabditis angaria]